MWLDLLLKIYASSSGNKVDEPLWNADEARLDNSFLSSSRNNQDYVLVNVTHYAVLALITSFS